MNRGGAVKINPATSNLMDALRGASARALSLSSFQSILPRTSGKNAVWYYQYRFGAVVARSPALLLPVYST